MLSLVRGDPPDSEAVSETKAALWRASPSEDSDWFTEHVPLIRDEFERTLGRALITSAWTLTLDKEDLYRGDGSLRDEILMPMVPLVAVSGITYTDNDDVTATWATTGYAVVGGEHGRVALKYQQDWPAPTAGLRRYACMEISFTAGYGTAVTSVPGPLLIGLRELITFWYANRGEGYVIGRPASPEGGVDVRAVPRQVEKVYARLHSFRNLATL